MTKLKASSVTYDSLTLTWKNPSSSSLSGVLIREAKGGAAPSSPTKGILVADVAAPATQFTVTKLLSNTTYSFSLFAHDASKHYAQGAKVTATTLKTVAPVIKSVNKATFIFGVSGSFTVKATGVPAPTITESGSLPGGVTLARSGVLSGRASSSGSFPIAITASNGIGRPAKQSFVLSVLRTPSITSISPAAGPLAGGTVVTIVGMNLAGATKVSFGGTLGTITSDTGTRITALSPAHAQGTVDVAVTTQAGTSATLPADEFAFSVAITPCSGPITGDSLILAGSYVLNCNLDVLAGVTLTIEPGAILKLGGGNELTVEGTLDAVGTASQPITFTSVNDNSIGGVTGTGSPAAGDWGGIWLSGDAQLDLESAHVEYSAYVVVSNGLNSDGSVLAVNDTFKNDYEGANVHGGRVNFSNDTFVVSNFGLIVYSSTPTIMNDSVTTTGSSTSYPAYWVNGSIDPGMLTGDTASGLVPEFELEGSIGTSGTLEHLAIPWFTGGLDVPQGVTLTIAAGTVIKGLGNSGGTITVEGTLDAVGTASQPITFTSVNDNSIGGVTGTGSPAAGDWGGIWLSGDAQLDLESAHVEYSAYVVVSNGLNSDGSVLAVNDTFKNDYEGANVHGGRVNFSNDTFVVSNFGLIVYSSTPTIMNDSVTTTGSSTSYPAYWVNGSIDPGMLTGDTASGLVPEFELEGSIGTSGTLEHLAIPWFTGGLDVPQGVTLTIAAGTVIKGLGNSGGTITVEGTLDAVGTASQPITFTSVNDNSIGGVTGTGSPAAGDWGGIWLSGDAQLDLESAHVEYSAYVVVSNGLNSDGSVLAVNDTFKNDYEGANVHGGRVNFSNDTFVVSNFGLIVYSSTPTIMNDSVTTTGSSTSYPAYWVNGSIDPGMLTGDTASGLVPEFELEGSIGTSGTLEHLAIPWFTGGLDVPQGVTLTIAAGTVIKGLGNSGGTITVEGTLDAVGTASQPITFTSVNDNSIGGVTGTGSPAAGDWGGIGGTTTASIDIQNSVVDYAATGLDISGGSGELVLIDLNSFASNGTAVSISAATTTNAQIESNNFSQNTVAINASSNWSTVTVDPASCFYLPTMTATGNTFNGSTTPLVTPTDYATITGGNLGSLFGVPTVESYPDGWSDPVKASNSDTIAVSYEPCIDPVNPSLSYVAIAIPLNL